MSASFKVEASVPGYFSLSTVDDLFHTLEYAQTLADGSSAVYYGAGGQLYHTINLPSGGCPTGNCTNDCQNITKVFGDHYTTLNCLLYPFVATQIARNNISDGLDQLYNKLGFVNDSNIADAVYNVTSSCLNGYYDTYQVPYRTWRDTYYNYYPSTYNSVNLTVSTAEGPSYMYYNPCNARLVGYSTNQDISGVGVVISYFLQLGLALFFFAYSRFCSSWIYWLLWIWTSIWRRTPLRLKPATVEAVQRWARNQVNSMIPATVDFHKTQCFFMCAVQVAALLALKKTINLNANYLLEVLVDEYVFTAIPLGGIVPVVMTLAQLHIYGRKSWYLFSLTIVTWALSLSVLLGFSGSDYDPSSITPVATGVAACGGANPATFCSRSVQVAGQTSTGYRGYSPGLVYPLSPLSWIVGFTAAVLLMLLIDLIIGHHARWSRFLQRRLPLPVRQRIYFDEEGIATKTEVENGVKRLSFPLRLTALIISYVVYLIFLGLFCFFYAYLVMFLQELIPGGTYSDPTSEQWSYGQIVSIAIWAPVVCEFIYLEFRGIDNILYRLSPNYVIIQRMDDSVRWRPTNVSYFLQQPMLYIIAVIREHRQEKKRKKLDDAYEVDSNGEISLTKMIVRPTRQLTGLGMEGLKSVRSFTGQSQEWLLDRKTMFSRTNTETMPPTPAETTSSPSSSQTRPLSEE